MLNVQKFLLDKSFQNLIDDHAVYASPSKDFSKISLNYCQITSIDSNIIVQECRGLVLRLKNHKSFSNLNKGLDLNCIIGETEIVAMPFTRFFNYGQGAAASVNLDNCYCWEKLDGTLCILSKDKVKNEWHISTRSVPEADVPLNFPEFTFRTLFEKALFDTCNLTFEQFTSGLNVDRTYCFELTTPYNQVVVSYKECCVHLLMVRDLISLKEISLDLIEECSMIPKPKKYKLNVIDDMINFVNEQNPSENEGIVICDYNFNRLKIKNAGYVAYSKIIDRVGYSYRNCLALVLSDKVDDVLFFMPDKIKEVLLEMKDKFVELNNNYNRYYIKSYQSLLDIKSIHTDINERKEFAKIILSNKNIWGAPLFEIYDKKVCNIKEYIESKRSDGEWSNAFLDRVLDQIGMLK